MRPPRDLSGRELANHLCRLWEYFEVHQTGSHIILQPRRPDTSGFQSLPTNQLRIGTLNAILRRIATHKGVSREEILKSLD